MSPRPRFRFATVAAALGGIISIAAAQACSTNAATPTAVPASTSIAPSPGNLESSLNVEMGDAEQFCENSIPYFKVVAQISGAEGDNFYLVTVQHGDLIVSELLKLSGSGPLEMKYTAPWAGTYRIALDWGDKIASLGTEGKIEKQFELKQPQCGSGETSL